MLNHEVRINDTVIKSFGVGKVFRSNEAQVNSLCFTATGEYLLSSGDDGRIHVYDCTSAEPTEAKTLHSFAFGAQLLRTFHAGKNEALLTGKTPDIRHLDLWSNQFTRCYRGHTGQILSLDAHPTESRFVSASTDGSVLLWDTRQENPVARIHGGDNTIARFDMQGAIFALSSGQKVHLFDARKFSVGEFAQFGLKAHIGNPDAEISGIWFSPCDKFLAVQTDKYNLLCVDAFDGKVLSHCYYDLQGETGELVENMGSGPSVSFSPCSQYMASGAPDGTIHIWKRTSGELVHKLEGHPQFPRQVAFSPRKVLLVSADTNTAMWIADGASIR